MDWNAAGENVEAGVPVVFVLFSTKRGKARRSASMGDGGGSARIGTRRGRTLSVPAVFALFSAKRGKAWRSASMGNGGGSARIGTMRGRTLSVPAVFALFLREERKSVAFCEYGERRMVLHGLERCGGER